MDERTRYLGLRLPLTLDKRLTAAARRENNHISAVTRRLLTKALDREEADAARAATRQAKRGA